MVLRARYSVHAYGIKRAARLCKLTATEFYVASIIVGISFPALLLWPRGEQHTTDIQFAVKIIIVYATLISDSRFFYKRKEKGTIEKI